MSRRTRRRTGQALDIGIEQRASIRNLESSAKNMGERTAGRPANSFDHWLTNQLRDMYNAVLDEPLPDDLVNLIKKSRENDDNPDDGNRE